MWKQKENSSRITEPTAKKRTIRFRPPPIFLPRKKTCKITEELSVRSSLPPFPYVKPFANAVNRGTVLPLKIPPSPASTFLTSYFRVHPFEILRVWLASPFLSPTQLARFPPQPRIQCSFFKDRCGRTAGFLRRQERRRGGGDRLPRPPSPPRRKSAEREKRPNTTLRRKCSKKQESCAVFFSSHFCSIAW